MTSLISTKFKDNSKVEYLFSNKKLFNLFLPLIIEQFLEFAVGLINSIIVASVGEAAVSGVSIIEFIMMLLISVFAALSAGGSVIARQCIGKMQVDKARQAVDQLIWFVGSVAIVIMLLIYLLKPFILITLFGQISQDVYTEANTYLMIVGLTIPFLGLYGACVAIFRTMGNTKLPMKISLLMGIMTVIGNALMLYVFDMGTEGVAISTLFSRVLATIILLLYVVNTKLPLYVKKTLKHDFDWAMIRRMMGIGMPYGLENGLFYFGRIVVLGLVAIFGTASIAANAIGGTIVLFEVLPGIAIGLGMTVVIAQCIGAGDYEQARYYTKKIIAIIYVAHIIINAMVLALWPYILNIYNLSEKASYMTTQIVTWHALGAVTLWPLAYTLPVTFRAAGDAKYPMYVGVLTMFFCRIALAYLFAIYLSMGMLGTWAAMFVDWFVKSVLFVWRYFNNKWTLYKAI